MCSRITFCRLYVCVCVHKRVCVCVCVRECVLLTR